MVYLLHYLIFIFHLKKIAILDDAQKEVEVVKSKFNKHILTEGERYNKTIDIWTHATSDVASEMFKN